MKILYSHNKNGYEEEYWSREISNESIENFEYIPFNHGGYITSSNYLRAQELDNLYYSKDSRLLSLYEAVRRKIIEEGVEVLIVDNANPYHPDFLKTLDITKIQRTTDGPLAAYDRDIPYFHAFDAVLYHSPAYSEDLNMEEKLSYCGVRNKFLWPLASFEAVRSTKKEDELFSLKRNRDIAFVGALFPNKMPLIASVKKEFGKNFHLHGLANMKKNLYFNAKFGFPGWVTPIDFVEYVPLYERTKIGINVHNRGKYTVGGYRLFDLPANGVMQISDGGKYLEEFFKIGIEIESYESSEELIDKIKYYLKNDLAREKIARAGYRRVMKDHTMKKRLSDLKKVVLDLR